MKKKLALLLALAMVISLIPVTPVFGSTTVTRVGPVKWLDTGAGGDLGNTHTVQFEVPLGYLWSNTTGAGLLIDLNSYGLPGGNNTTTYTPIVSGVSIEFVMPPNTKWMNAMGQDATTGATSTALDIAMVGNGIINSTQWGPVGVEMTLTPFTVQNPGAGNGTFARSNFQISDRDGFLLNQYNVRNGGYLLITLEYEARAILAERTWESVQYNFTPYSLTVGQNPSGSATGWQTVASILSSDLATVAVPAATARVSFADNGKLGSLTVTEVFAGSFTENDTITLDLYITSPNVRWDAPKTGSNNPLYNGVGTGYSSAAETGRIRGDGTVFPQDSGVNAVVTVANNDLDRPFITYSSDDESIRLQKMTIAINLSGLTRNSLPLVRGSFTISDLKIYATDRARVGNVDILVRNSGAWGQSNIGVAPNNRYETWGAAALTGRTVAVDYRAAYKRAQDVFPTAEEIQLYSGDLEVTSAWISVTELTANAFQLVRNSPIRFSVPEGVKITFAEARRRGAHETSNEGSAVAATDINIARDGSYFDIFPYINREDADTGRVAFDVRLQLSIVPGYVQQYDEEEILVTVGGVALNDVTFVDAAGKSSDGIIAVAEVADRIAVEMELTTQPFMPGTGQHTVNMPLENIVIKELEPGALRANTTIEVAIDDVFQFAVLTSGRPNTDATSGLEISGFTRADGKITFDILRESRGDEPGVITIPAVSISGSINPLTTYSIVVGGTAVASSYDINGFHPTNTPQARDPQRIHTENYYKADAFVYTGDNPSVVTPLDPDTGGPGEEPITGPTDPITPVVPVLPLAGERLTNDAPFVMNNGQRITDPLRFDVDFPAGTQGVVLNTGYISIRAFAEMAGSVALYDSATRSTTITIGNDTVVIRNRDSIAYFNGMPRQFTNNDGAVCPTVDIMVDGEFRNFVPVRKLAEWFGYDILFDRGTMSVTFVPFADGK